MNRFAVRFWGVRGSVATSGRNSTQVGGNTSCVEVRAGKEIIILNGGTRLARLGEWSCNLAHANFFFSHLHWDPIQGFPFFRRAYVPGNAFTLYGTGEAACELNSALDRQMQRPNFAVTLAHMSARIEFRSIRPGQEVTVGAVRIRAGALNHPQGCLGYRISVGASSFV